jgi:cell division protein FtsB
MKWLTLALAGLVVLIQFPLWLGKGGWLRVWEVDQQIQSQREINVKLTTRNGALDAEVRDLKQGLEAIEERARSELGMIRQDEMFFQLLDGAVAAPRQLTNRGKPDGFPSLRSGGSNDTEGNPGFPP